MAKLNSGVLVLVTIILLTGCSPSSCNKELLGIFTRTGLAEFTVSFSEMLYRRNNLSVDGMEWSIKPKANEGCNVILLAKSNGEDTIAAIYYIRLKDGQVFADDQNAMDLMQIGYADPVFINITK